ncbi:MAG: hypothetical protein KKD77_23820, partial [Gammaproteobacteria bacterium]|nr:hypothetical protein [Gammaproteobacteria bacterium]
NVGEFYQAAVDHLNISKSTVDAEISMYDITNPGQREKAWLTICGVYAPQDTPTTGDSDPNAPATEGSE